MTPEVAANPLVRLALAYAPAAARPAWADLFALDARLAGIVRSAREPMLAQLRLAWWRERFGSPPGEWPKGEPLLASLAGWGHPAAGLGALVDGWEALLGEAPLDRAALSEFAAGRAAAAAALAGHVGAPADAAAALGRRWALSDLALRTSHPDEREAAAGLLHDEPAAPTARPALRPLAVIAGLGARAVARGAAEPLSGPAALLVAMRLGLIGR